MAPIILDVQQGTTEWAMARLGIPTASRFDKILTPAKLEPSKTMDTLAYELLAEQILGAPLNEATSGFMQRGSIQEKKAVQYYEFQRDVETTPVGFVLRADRRVGCSPDRFVGTDGGMEIKSPAAKTHVEYLLDDEGIGYRLQVQGCLWLTEREWWDTLSFNPFMPAALVRQYRDEKVIKALERGVSVFLETMDQLKAKLLAKGCVFPTLAQEAKVA